MHNVSDADKCYGQKWGIRKRGRELGMVHILYKMVKEELAGG